MDTVTNAAPFTSGLDAETDDAARVRFVLFIDSRSRGTMGAARYAVLSYRQGLDVTVVETAGSYTLYVDDGSGAPSTALLAGVFAAADAVRPLGTTLYVLAPTVVTAAISMTISTAPGYTHAVLIGQVATALLAYIAGLAIGAPLAYARLGQIAMNVTGVTNARSILLNGVAGVDIGGGTGQVVRAVSAGIVVA